MNTHWKKCEGVSGWGFALIVAMVLAPAGLAQHHAGADLVASGEEDADPNPAALDANAPRSPRRIGEVVNVFGNTEVRPGENAWSVVTVWGDTRVEGEVGGECVTVFGNATLTGEVRGECVTVFGDLDLDGEVRGEVVVVMGNARFGPRAKVHGECIVIGGKITADPEATFLRMKREFAAFLPPLGAWVKYGLLWGRPLVPSLGWVWIIFLLHFILYLLVAVLVPKPVEACERVLREQPLATFAVGLLGLFLFWPAVTIIAATGVGLLVIPFMLIAALGAVILGKTAVLQWMGSAVLRPTVGDATGTALFGFLVGTAIVAVLYMMPVLGFMTWGLLLPLGFGAALMALVELIRQNRAKRPPAPLVPVSVAALRDPAAATEGLRLPASGTSASSTAPDAAPPTPEFGPGPQPPPATSPASPLMPGGLAVETTGLPRAGFWIRLAAALLDFVLLGWFVQLVDGYFPLLWIAYHIGMWTWKGTTIGGIVCGLKVVREDGRRVDFTVALVRSLAAVFSFVALGIGFFWAGWSPERQSWHDKIAGTVIVKVPKGMSLI